MSTLDTGVLHAMVGTCRAHPALPCRRSVEAKSSVACDVRSAFLLMTHGLRRLRPRPDCPNGTHSSEIFPDSSFPGPSTAKLVKPEALYNRRTAGIHCLRRDKSLDPRLRGDDDAWKSMPFASFPSLMPLVMATALPLDRYHRAHTAAGRCPVSHRRTRCPERLSR